MRRLLSALLCLSAAAASAADWPHFLGPTHNAFSSETHLLKSFPPSGPPILWQHEKGVGFAAPVIAANHLVLFHRVADKETVECLEARTGKPLWKFAYPAPYTANYGDRPSTRSSPVIADDRVFTYGVVGLLHCFDLKTGKVQWKRDFSREPGLAPAFFGTGSTPIVIDDQIILNAGLSDGTSVISLDTATGKERWKTKHAWGASYASPIPATIHGRECILVFAGGKSDPPNGGLLTLDAKTGAVLNATPHRSDMVASVSASSPVLADPKRGLVFVSEAYGSGGVMIEIAPDFSAKVAWSTEKLGCYWMTPIVKDGCLYGFDGQAQRLAELVCLDVQTGRHLWRDDLGGVFQRGSLLAVDGSMLCLGENGDLGWLNLSPKGATVSQRVSLFRAPETWTLPALSDGLLFVNQNERSSGGTTPRVICYDLRASAESPTAP